MNHYKPGDRIRMDSAFDRAVPYLTEGTVTMFHPERLGPGTVNVHWDNGVNRIDQTCYHIRKIHSPKKETTMQTFDYLVTIDAASKEAADKVIEERIGHDEEYPEVGDYGITVGPAPAPTPPAQPEAKESIFPITYDLPSREAFDAEKKAMRETLVSKLDHVLEFDKLNEVLEALGLEPMVTMIEVDVTLAMRLVVNVNSGETSLAVIRQRFPDFLTVTDGRVHLADYAEDYLIRDVEEPELTVKEIRPRYF